MHANGGIAIMIESPPVRSVVDAVAEIQGLYGAFSFPERLLQKIWRDGDFDHTSIRTADGRTLKILHPGRWNHLGGPDFALARLVIDGREITGDVELHLHAKDWAAHGHIADRAYDNVVLHVVLFPCPETHTEGAGERKIPILCLLPLLHHGLEEYAEEDAMERLAGRPLHHAQGVLGALSHQELDTLLRAHAEQRWRSKVRFARARIDRLGWEGACHHAALEILGYRFNRAPMLSVATAFPLAEWANGRADPVRIYEELDGCWSLQGVRPLNHPRLRLRQYATWCLSRPDWPDRLRGSVCLSGLARDWSDTGTGAWRRSVSLTNKRTWLQNDVCGSALSGSRLDNVVCDGFMPLMAAKTGVNLQAAWAGWFAGDAPPAVMRVLRVLGVFDGRVRPVAQGPIQGLLGWILNNEPRLQGHDASPSGAGLDKILPRELP
jgi:hypothetical protein